MTQSAVIVVVTQGVAVEAAAELMSDEIENHDEDVAQSAKARLQQVRKLSIPQKEFLRKAVNRGESYTVVCSAFEKKFNASISKSAYNREVEAKSAPSKPKAAVQIRHIDPSTKSVTVHQPTVGDKEWIVNTQRSCLQAMRKLGLDSVTVYLNGKVEGHPVVQTISLSV